MFSSKSELHRLYDREKMQALMATHCIPENMGGYLGYCFSTSLAVCRFFIEDKIKANVTLSSLKEPLFHAFLYEKNDSYSQPIEFLLTPSRQPEHLLFKLDFLSEIHSLVIEKESDGNITEWTIYQSHVLLFTLSQWMGRESSWLGNYIFDPTDIDCETKKIYSEAYTKYGAMKSLNSHEIAEFFEKLVNHCANISGMYVSNREKIEIQIYKISDSFLDRYLPTITEDKTKSEKIETDKNELIAPVENTQDTITIFINKKLEQTTANSTINSNPNLTTETNLSENKFVLFNTEKSQDSELTRLTNELKYYPDHVDNRLKRADIYINNKDYKKAYEDYKHVNTLYPANIRAANGIKKCAEYIKTNQLGQ